MESANRYESQRKVLDTQRLIAEAKERAGLTDFGDMEFVLPLDTFLECASSDCDFHPVGLQDLREEVVRDLVNKLRFRNDLKLHPEILDEDVSDPIVIMGVPRTGTTKTHRMMGTDPSLLKTYAWQLLNIAPFPGTERGQEPDPRAIAAKSGNASLLFTEIEEMQAGHHMAPDQIDEDWTLFEQTFNEWYYLNRQPSWSFHKWVTTRTQPSDLSNYQYVRSIFQYLQWQQGGRKGRRWLMKSCGHLAYLKELLEVFPKATLVHIHRHPHVSMPSICKLMQTVWPLRVDGFGDKQIGELLLDWTKLTVDKYLVLRDKLNLGERIFDVQYEQIRNDPIPVFREIYRRAGHEFTADAEQRMRQWEAENEQGKHGKHIYSLEQFGLSEKIIDDAFGDYMRCFCAG